MVDKEKFNKGIIKIMVDKRKIEQRYLKIEVVEN